MITLSYYLSNTNKQPCYREYYILPSISFCIDSQFKETIGDYKGSIEYTIYVHWITLILDITMKIDC